jgi:hypothetical protein
MSVNPDSLSNSLSILAISTNAFQCGRFDDILPMGSEVIGQLFNTYQSGAKKRAIPSRSLSLWLIPVTEASESEILSNCHESSRNIIERARKISK